MAALRDHESHSESPSPGEEGRRGAVTAQTSLCASAISHSACGAHTNCDRQIQDSCLHSLWHHDHHVSSCAHPSSVQPLPGSMHHPVDARRGEPVKFSMRGVTQHCIGMARHAAPLARSDPLATPTAAAALALAAAAPHRGDPAIAIVVPSACPGIEILSARPASPTCAAQECLVRAQEVSSREPLKAVRTSKIQLYTAWTSRRE